jgi:acyl-CoA-binding protein
MLSLSKLFLLALSCSAHPDYAKCLSFWKDFTPAEVMESLDRSDKIRTEALYRQARYGDGRFKQQDYDHVRQPTLDIIKCWNRLRGMSREDAEIEFVKLVDRVVPAWRARRI